MKPVVLFEREGMKVTASGSFSRSELDILEFEVKVTLLSILKNRKFGGGSI